MIERVFGRHAREFGRALKAKQYERTDAGIYFPRQGATLSGAFDFSINRGRRQHAPNVLTDVFVQYLTYAMFEDAVDLQIGANLHMSQFSADVFPDATWDMDADFLPWEVPNTELQCDDPFTTERGQWIPYDLGTALYGVDPSSGPVFECIGAGVDIYGFAIIFDGTIPSPRGIGSPAWLVSATRLTGAPAVLATGDFLDLTWSVQLQ